MNTKTTKNILIACALQKELQVAKKYFSQKRPENIQVDFVVTGMWNISASIKLTEQLSTKKYDFLLNYGVCGYKESKQDCIQIVRSVYSEAKKEILTPVFFSFAPLTSILCSEVPIDTPATLWEENYVDMESYAIEKVCEHFKTPRLILKVPVDKVWVETQNFDIAKALALLEKNIDFDALISKIQSYLESLPIAADMNKYYEHFHFTVSEKILLEKYVHKLESLSQESFHSFFLEHKHLSKKDFLSHLSEVLSTLSRI